MAGGDASKDNRATDKKEKSSDPANNMSTTQVNKETTSNGAKKTSKPAHFVGKTKPKGKTANDGVENPNR